MLYNVFICLFLPLQQTPSVKIINTNTQLVSSEVPILLSYYVSLRNFRCNLLRFPFLKPLYYQKAPVRYLLVHQTYTCTEDRDLEVCLQRSSFYIAILNEPSDSSPSLQPALNQCVLHNTRWGSCAVTQNSVYLHTTRV